MWTPVSKFKEKGPSGTFYWTRVLRIRPRDWSFLGPPPIEQASTPVPGSNPKQPRCVWFFVVVLGLRGRLDRLLILPHDFVASKALNKLGQAACRCHRDLCGVVTSSREGTRKGKESHFGKVQCCSVQNMWSSRQQMCDPTPPKRRNLLAKRAKPYRAVQRVNTFDVVCHKHQTCLAHFVCAVHGRRMRRGEGSR